jgi:hypothetical protein
MPDFIVLKKNAETGQASDWTPIVIALSVENEQAAAKQSYTGEGTYKVLLWDDDIETVVTAGEPEVTMVSKKQRAEEAEAAEVAAAKAA